MPGWGRGGVFDIEIIERLPGFLVFRAVGRDANEVFRDEAGGHRFQRVPPNEKRGRVQTSTVTIAVLPEPTEAEVHIDERDVDVQTCRAGGSGGQKVNKTESAVQITHRPSGIMVRCESERSQYQNKATAFALLRARLQQTERERATGARAADRRAQVGSGMRGDKRRTIRCQDGAVQDHVTGRSWQFSDYEKGRW